MCWPTGNAASATDMPVAQRRLTDLPPIRAMAQDRSGFLWIGTEGGLYRYDGRRAQRVTPSDLGAITSVALDAESGLWLLAHEEDTKRLYRLTEGQLAPATNVLAAVGTSVDQIVADRNSGLWILSDHKLYLYTSGVTRLAKHQPDSVESIFEIDGNLWLSTKDAVYRHEGGAFILKHRISGVIRAVGTDSVVWMLTKDNKWFRQDVELPNELMRQVSGPVNALAAWRDGLLIGTDDRPYWTDGVRVVRPQPFDALHAWIVNGLAVDKSGTAWIGTDFDGLFALQSKALVQTLDAMGPMQMGRATYSVTSDGANGVWAVNNHSISHWQDGVETQIPIPADFQVYSPRSISVGPDDSVWVSAAERGVLRLAGGRFDLQNQKHGLPESSVAAVFHDAHGSLLVGFEGGGFARFADERFEMLPAFERACPATPTALSLGANNELWVATQGAGLCHWDGHNLTRFTAHDGLPEDDLRSVYVDHENRVWVGGNERGLAVRSGARFLRVPLQVPLHKEEISAITEDADNHLWLGTPRGLLRVSRAQAWAAAHKPTTALPVLRLGMQAGLPTGTFLAAFPPSVAKTRDGSLWFPSLRGLVKIAEPETVAALGVPVPILENIQINGARLSAASPPVASHASLSATISLPALQHPERFVLRHKLHGIDEDWQATPESGVVQYQRLPPGRYQFQVLAHVEGALQTQEASVAFVLLPPFYRRSWFLGFCILGLFSVLWSIHRLRLWRQRDRFETVAAERVRIARDMHDTLEQTLIGMRMQLESIRKRADDTQLIQEKIKRMESLLDQGLHETKQTVWALRMPLLKTLELKDALALTGGKTLRGTDVVFLTKSTGKAWPTGPQVQAQLASIVQEATNNALKHGKATEIQVNLQYASTKLTLTVSDNGLGFDEALAAGPDTGHFGLCGMQERASLVGAEMRMSSRPGQGTKVCIEIPRTVSATNSKKTRFTE